MSNNNIICGKSFEAYELEWDTTYFGVSSAKVLLKEEINSEEQNILMSFIKQFEFITIVNMGNNNSNNIWLGRDTDAFISDINIQYTKNIMPNTIDSKLNAKVYNGYSTNEKILKVAEKAFKFSRFFNDPWLSKDKKSDIYVNWTNNTFHKSDKFFSIVEIRGEIAGYLIFNINIDQSCATIELIAVDEEYRGQSIGKSLVASVEKYIEKINVKILRVGTQVDNIAAMNFYNSCQFKYDNSSAIYHFWPNK